MKDKGVLIVIIIIFVVLIVGSMVLYNKINEESFIKDVDYSSNEKAKASNFAVEDEEDKQVELNDFKGKPVIINFWATWCTYCVEEMPHFSSLYEEFKDEVEFLMIDAIDSNGETKEKAKAFVKDNNYKFPIYFDTTGDVISRYRVSGFPTTVIIDKDGNIVFRKSGIVSEGILRSYINKIK